MEILNTETITNLGGWGVVFIILGFTFAIVGTVTMFSAMEYGDGGIALIGFVIAVSGVLVAVNFHDVGETSYKQHEVIVEDFNEIYEQGYEIVEQEGKIVTIKKEGAGE